MPLKCGYVEGIFLGRFNLDHIISILQTQFWKKPFGDIRADICFCVCLFVFAEKGAMSLGLSLGLVEFEGLWWQNFPLKKIVDGRLGKREKSSSSIDYWKSVLNE